MTTSPFQSKLIPYEKEIFDLWYHQRATLKTIQAHLEEKGMNITLAGISGFIRRRKAKEDPHSAESVRKQAKKKQTPVERAIEMLDELSSK